MTFEDLIEFVSSQMRMSHIYQPLLIRSLVDAGGSATLRQLAQTFLVQDESQLLYYEKRIKEMPLKVLSKHGIVRKDGDLVSLETKDLTLQQKAQVRALCEQKLQEYVQKKGLGIWDYRLLETDPVPDSSRFIVLKESGGKCALCGCTKDDRPLEVDHIIPRNRGGSNEFSNLQVLCSKCNRSKRDKDTTDFRNLQCIDNHPTCLFCSEEIQTRIVATNGSVFAVGDKYPVTQGHLLISPYRHTEDYFSMSQEERQHSEELIRVLRNKLIAEDKSVKGFNVGINCGKSAGQTVMHAHIHLIPRRDGDTPEPRGGVRGCVPGKMGY